MDAQARWGQIGGLVAWSRHDAETMQSAARRGFRARFERLVDPDGNLDPAERARRADRARRAWMLKLAARSAEVRRNRKAAPVCDDSGTADGGRTPHAHPA
jgi:hypothetical protein